MKYLREFENHNQYEAFTATTDFILPNVSICTTEGDVHYNPYVAPDIRLIAIFNVLNAPSEIKIMGYDEMEGVDAREYFSKIEIDGVEQPSVNYKYTFNTTGEHTIKYTLKDPTTIGGGTFQYLYDAPFSVIIPNSVITIDSWSLCANNLTSITIPNSVTSIGNYALSNCENLTSITIPNSVTSIGVGVFGSCYGLTSVTVPDSITSISSGAFAGCSGLTSCTIGSGVTSIGTSTNIGSGVFAGCSSLTRLNSDTDGVFNIPSGVTFIRDYSFDGCYGLTSINIPSGVTSIGNYIFRYCRNLTSINIPSGVTSIGNGAFQNCSGLTSCTIGSGVTTIGGSAFESCSGLTSITSNAMTAPTIGSNTFRGVHTGGTLRVPSGSSGYNTWMGTGNYYLGLYNWTKVEQ